MVQKYTILKVLIQSISKVPKSKSGFTLIELIVGMSIMLIVGSLAMTAFIQASTTFNKDKKSIETSQSMSVILEMIGNDIKQSGENINNVNFPTIEFITNTDSGSMPNSSKIIVRRALIDPLTLCESIPTSPDPTTKVSLVVADNALATVTASANCNVGTSSSKLVAARPSTEYELTATTDPVPSTSLATLDLILPRALRTARDYRCQLDDPNPTVAYDDPSRATDTFCNSSSLEVTRVAVSNLSGQFLIFNQTNETVDAANTATVKKYGITVNTTGLSAIAIANNNKNKVVVYPIGSPIYVIEERVYTLTSDGKLQVSIDGKDPETLIKKIDNFRVSARIYTNATDRLVQPTPTPITNICTDAVPFAAQPATASVDTPKYVCQFNYFTGTAATDKADWKTLAGIKVEIQTKYDGTGQNAIATTNDSNKLYAASEFFPRNVLSK